MSKQPVSPELLSAYFDGEVTAEERAAVTRAAEESPDVQQTLDDYLQLTKDIQSLRETVSSPRLADSVLASLSASVTPAEAVTPESTSRPWMQVAGLVTTLAAACLLVMFWPAGPQGGDRAEVAEAKLDEISQPARELSDELALADAAPAASAAREPEMLLESGPAALPALSESHADNAPARVASAPVESLLGRVTKDQDIPEPGDVVKYLVEVADETVWIPLTVVDVQMTAGEVQYLLTRHGIESPVGAKEIGDSTSNANVVILVESDWEKLAEVVQHLEDEGLGTELDVETSIVMQKDKMEQQRAMPTERQRSQATAEAIASAPPAPEPENAAQPLNEVAESLPTNEAAAETRPEEMFHAQLSARVSDRDVHAFKLEGRSIFSGSRRPGNLAREKSTAEEQESPAAEPAVPALPHEVSGMHASPSRERVRFVFVIQKSD